MFVENPLSVFIEVFYSNVSAPVNIRTGFGALCLNG
jgi:hypothetical protein